MAEANKTIVLRTSDGIDFEVEEDVAKVSNTIGNMINDGVPEGGVPLRDVTGKVMMKIIEYAKKHVGSEKEGRSDGDDLENWDAEFVKFANVDKAMLFDMMEAAHSLNIKSLSNLLSMTVADIIKDMTVEQTRNYFNITFTPEEEEEFRRQNEQTSVESVRPFDLN